MIFGSRDPATMKYRWSGGTYSGAEIEGTHAMLYVDQVDPPTLSHAHNPILAAFRLDGDVSIDWWLTDNLDTWGTLWTPDQIEHARRVLTRLASWEARS